ncbi:replication-relaxation family protein [Nocardiopsis chromatogenes]|uniref:replication-relaxation family protein n=1 Tax=Nocardiopsis chromatogenes TaxID=280239 RepID=UPI000349F483|nr:replication-relaxation family protein [Nocardiopsis chromatogenes]
MKADTHEDAQRHAELALLLSDRDRDVIRAIGKHRVMTTHHLHALFFANVDTTRTRRRLKVLYDSGLLQRFRPSLRKGTAPWHWVLSPEGERLLDDMTGARRPYGAMTPAIRLAHSQRLGHFLGISETYVAFATAGRALPGEGLRGWRNEAECAEKWDRRIFPDAWLLWAQDGTDLGAFIEYDNGTEVLYSVAKKLRRYSDIAAVYGETCFVLFIVPAPGREEALAQTLDLHMKERVQALLTTTGLLAHPGPAAAIWRTAQDHYRMPLSAAET